MSSAASGPAPGPNQSRILIHRVREGDTDRVRITGEPPTDKFGRLLGYETHFLKDGRAAGKGKTHPCQGGRCPHPHNKIDTLWYAYLSVDVWLDMERLWKPAVLQVSESLELDMRGKVEKGQFWDISKLATKGKGSPYRGIPTGYAELQELPQGTIVLAVLRQTWHAPWLQPPEIVNPAEPRVYGEMKAGTPPPGTIAFDEEQMRLKIPSPQERQKMREELRKRMGSIGG